MTTLFMDPFSQYGGNSANMLNGVYADLGSGATLGVAPWDSTGAAAYHTPGSAGGFSGARRVISQGNQTNVVVGFRYGVTILPIFNDTHAVWQFRNGSNSAIATVFISTTGAVYVKDSTGTQVAITNGPVIVAGNYQHWEMQMDYAGGNFVLRIDDASGTGTPVINASGINWHSAGPIAQFMLPGVNSGEPSSGYLKDLIMRNTSGSVNNGFNGDEHVIALFADADTANAGWTPQFYHLFGPGILNNTSASACYSAPNSTQTDLGSGDFTIESFVRFKSMPTAAGYSTIMSKWDSVNNKRSYRFIYGGSSFNTNNLQFDISTDGTSSGMVNIFQYPWIPDMDVWYHMAVVRVSGQTLLFVNGNQLGLPITDSHTYYAGTEPLGVCGEIQGTNTVVANTNLTGWLDETRLTVGYARYNAPFTPPVVAFPRGSGSDAHWSNVQLLAGYDSLIQDESAATRTLTAYNGCAQFTVSDGPAIGSWSTLGANKVVPDDNTFMTAPYTAASGVLTMTTQPANNDTVTVGTKDGSTAAVYTFKTAIASAFDVLIDTTAQNTLINLYNAINAGSGAGTKYGTGTTANFDVTASQLPAGQLSVNANTLGTGGNSIATSATGTAASWGDTHLTGGANIPGPSDFKVQRPPPHTTVISAVQLNARMYKSDSGTCSVETGLVGPLGGVTYGAVHPLTTSSVWYADIVEADPDTAGPITPTTIVNGAIRLNRTA